MSAFTQTSRITDIYDYSSEDPHHIKYMKTYLISKCTGCTQIPCFNYHTGQNKRRLPILYTSGIWNYRPILCSKQSCPYKDFCLFSHSIEELNYHPLIYIHPTPLHP